MVEEKGPNTLTLVSSDGVPIVVDRKVAERSMLIVNMLEDLGDTAGAEVPIPNVRCHRQAHNAIPNSTRC
jgi:S-phase kinase-associated protein 1